MSYINLTCEDAIWHMQLCHGDNRINDESLDQWTAALDQVEATSGNCALIITSSDAKFFSNGLDLEGVVGSKGLPHLINVIVPRFEALLVRLARLSLPVVVAVNGHAYGGGALLASCADFRLMRSDRGRFCFPEIDVKLPLTEIMTEVVKLLPNQASAWEMVMTGAAWGGEEAHQRGIVDKALTDTELLSTALAIATALAQKDRKTYTELKRRWRSGLHRFV